MIETIAQVDLQVPRTLIELGGAVLLLSLVARVAYRVGFSPVPFYLFAGLVFGTGGLLPLSLGEDFIEVGAEIGVVLLLFLLGLEYSGEELTNGLRLSWRAGLLDVALNFTPGLLVGLALGWDPIAAILLGGVTFNTSSGIMARLLEELDRLGNRETPAVLVISVFEDLTNTFYLPIVGVLLLGVGWATGLLSVVVALGVVLLALAAGMRYGGQLSAIIASRSNEVVLLTTVGLVLTIAGIAEQVQISAAIAAFLLGIALSGPVAEQTRRLLGPFRDLFAALFFLFFGLQTDPAAIPSVLPLALGLAVFTAVTKILTGWYSAARFGVGRRGRLRAGTALIPRGEFSIVIAGLGVTAGVEGTLGPLAAAYVFILAVLAPLLMRFSNQIHDRVTRRRSAR